MSGEYEAQRQHVLMMVESAQRAGRSENEISEIVDRYFEPGTTAHERGFVRRAMRFRRFDGLQSD